MLISCSSRQTDDLYEQWYVKWTKDFDQLRPTIQNELPIKTGMSVQQVTERVLASLQTVELSNDLVPHNLYLMMVREDIINGHGFMFMLATGANSFWVDIVIVDNTVGSIWVMAGTPEFHTGYLHRLAGSGYYVGPYLKTTKINDDLIFID